MLRVVEIHREDAPPFAYRLVIESIDEPGTERRFWVQYNPDAPEKLNVGGVSGITPSTALENVVREAIEKNTIPPGSRVEITEPPPPLEAPKRIIVTPGPAVGHAKAEDPTVVVGNTLESLEDGIVHLSRLSQVAFAARCSRRVLPLVQATWPDVPPDHLEFLENQIVVVERIAATGHGDPLSAPGIPRLVAEKVPAAELATSALSYAIFAANGALRREEYSFSPKGVWLCAERAVAAVVAFAQSIQGDIETVAEARRVVIEAVASDFHALQNEEKREGWSAENTVPREFFGPLWPKTPPRHWPQPGRQQLILDLRISEFAPTDEVAKELIRLFQAFNGYHIACGGSGLVIDDWQVKAQSESPVEAK